MATVAVATVAVATVAVATVAGATVAVATVAGATVAVATVAVATVAEATVVVATIAAVATVAVATVAVANAAVANASTPAPRVPPVPVAHVAQRVVWCQRALLAALLRPRSVVVALHVHVGGTAQHRACAACSAANFPLLHANLQAQRARTPQQLLPPALQELLAFARVTRKRVRHATGGGRARRAPPAYRRAAAATAAATAAAADALERLQEASAPARHS